MQYVSTRGQSGSCSFNDVLLTGLAPDGGLYVPEDYPQLTWNKVEEMKGWSYHAIARFILALFVGGDIRVADLHEIVNRSYDPRLFGSVDVTPIQPLFGRVGLLKLSNGPTLAFKDVALQLVANLMDHVLKERDEYLNIVGATSGDTGSAAEEAVRGRERLNIFMLSPYGRMTPIQQMQMYRLHEPNIFNLVPNGNFDSCQAAVKAINADADFKERYRIGAVNSINWARIVAQVIYYIYAYTRVVVDEDEILHVAVPSGNFGNALSAYIAGRMGLKLHVIVATNENDVLHEFFQTDVYRVRGNDQVLKTHSPSMDICKASNFERLMYDVTGGSADYIRELWKMLEAVGQFTYPVRFRGVYGPVTISSGFATDEEVIDTIRKTYHRHGIVIDPHTAVAMKVGLEQAGDFGLNPLLIAETAQPAKFEDVIERAIGLKMGIPPSCNHLQSREDRITRIEETEPAAIAATVKDFIEANVNL